MVNIYTLSHPITGEVRYVGKTTQSLKRRLNGHIQKSKTTSYYVSNWIKTLTNTDLKPNIELLDVVNDFEWEFWEQYWIAQCKAWGFKLTNITEGGDHCSRENVTLPSNTKTIYRYTLLGDFLDEHLSSKKLANKLKVYDSNIRFAAHNGTSCAGYRFAFYKVDKLTVTHRVKKAINQYDLEGNFIAEYVSTREACRITGVDYSNIGKVLNRRTHTAGGYSWKFKDVINN